MKHPVVAVYHSHYEQRLFSSFLFRVISRVSRVTTLLISKTLDPMVAHWTTGLLALSLCAGAGCITEPPSPDRALAPETKALEFLKREVPAWSKENGCFSCHNNGDAARALYTATGKGYDVPSEVLADTTAWIRKPERWEENKGDPGFSDKRLANLQFTASLMAAFQSGHVRDGTALKAAARKVAADQDRDGAWHIELQNSIGSPATYGTPLATYLALKTLERAGAPETFGAIEKAKSWLRAASPKNVISAAAILLAAADDPTAPGRLKLKECFTVLRDAQNRDGSWGPYRDSPGEAFDTAVALLALAELKSEPEIEALIRRGRMFLVRQQNEDGSWPGTTRPPGGNSYAQRISTAGWATLALLATRNHANFGARGDGRSARKSRTRRSASLPRGNIREH